MPVGTVRPDHPALEWAGAIEVEHTPEWSRAWRLPFNRLDLFPDDGLRQRASMNAGVRIRFRTTSTSVGVVVSPPEAPAEIAPIDLVSDGAYIATVSLGDDDRFGFSSLPAGDKVIELWLPQFGDVRLTNLTLDAGADLTSAGLSSSPRIVTYGSSITHCRAAASPTRTWPAIVARELGLHLTCLGYGGQAHLDQMIARMIGGLPADVITACMGINVYGNGSFNARSFFPAVLGFLSTIRDKHPETPILAISPIISPEREESLNSAGMTLREIRADVAAAVDALRRHGDANLHLLNGLEVIGPAEESVLFDGLHPDAKGYELMASRIKPVVARLLR